MKRDTLIKNLQKKSMRITFTKVNGEERIMDCTLQEHIVPPTKYTDRKRMKKSCLYLILIKVSGVRFVWTLLPI